MRFLISELTLKTPTPEQEELLAVERVKREKERDVLARAKVKVPRAHNLTHHASPRAS